MKYLKAIIFDVDDTLFDRDRAQREMPRIFMRELPDLFTGIDEETAVHAFEESDRLAMDEFYSGGFSADLRIWRSRKFLQLLRLDEGSAHKIARIYVELYPTVDAPVRGARSVIEKLAGRFQLGVVSNGFPDVQYLKLETLGVRHIFDCIVLSGEVGIWKPDPGIFRVVAHRLGRRSEECMYIGDSYDSDILGAKGAGMKACWFNPHGSSPSQEGIKPDLEIRSLDRLLEIVG